MKSSKFTGCWHSVWAIGFCVFAIIVTLTIGLFNHTQELYIRRSICMIGLYAEALDTQTMTELISNSFASQDQDDLYAAGCETLYKVGYGTSYQSLMRIPYQAAIFLTGLVLMIGYISLWYFFSRSRKHLICDVSSWIRDGEVMEYVGHLPQELYNAVLELKQSMARQAQLHTEKTENMFHYFENLSHQMKTPLAVIRAACERTEQKYPVCAQSMEVVILQVDRMTELISQILQLGRFDCGRQSLHFEYIQARDLLEAVINDFFALAAEKHIQFSIEGDPQIQWYCDTAWMQEAVANVIKNCIEHSNNGTIVLRYGITNRLNRLEILDCGEGFQNGYEKEAFQRYSTLGRSGKEGAGLGLAIAGQILKRHFGRAQAQNAPGGGAQFTFTFPMLDADKIYQLRN